MEALRSSKEHTCYHGACNCDGRVHLPGTVFPVFPTPRRDQVRVQWSVARSAVNIRAVLGVVRPDHPVPRVEVKVSLVGVLINRAVDARDAAHAGKGANPTQGIARHVHDVAA